ncbi:hypothetical protein FSHL1_009602 [Fusarium sambucinum]
MNVFWRLSNSVQQWNKRPLYGTTHAPALEALDELNGSPWRRPSRPHRLTPSESMHALGLRYWDGRDRETETTDYMVHNAGNDSAFELQIVLAIQYMTDIERDEFEAGKNFSETKDPLPYAWSGEHMDRVNRPPNSRRRDEDPLTSSDTIRRHPTQLNNPERRNRSPKPPPPKSRKNRYY